MRHPLKLLLPLLLFFSACHDATSKSSVSIKNGQPLPNLKVSSEDWSGDVTIFIAQSDPLSKQTTRFKLRAKYGDKTVGFYLDLYVPPDKGMFVSRGVVLRPITGESDNFLQALAQIYGVKGPTPAFADSVVATYAVLETEETKQPGNWAAAQRKLFFGDGSVELYMNIDPGAGTVSFPEKDSSYRAEIIAALSKEAKN